MLRQVLYINFHIIFAFCIFNYCFCNKLPKDMKKGPKQIENNNLIFIKVRNVSPFIGINYF